MRTVLIVFLFINLVLVDSQDGEEKKKNRRKPSGKEVKMNEAGDIDITIR